MTSAKFPFLLIVLSLILSVGCKKDPIEPPTPPVNNQTTKVAATVVVRTLDANGNALPGVAVQTGILSETTDSDGLAVLSSNHFNKGANTLSFSKNGHFTTYRKMTIDNGDVHSWDVVLHPTPAPLTFTAAAGGVVSFPSGISLEFSPASIVTQSGSPFSGTVEVISLPLNSSSSTGADILPNTLAAKGTGNQMKHLDLAGAVAVELRSGSSKLNLAPGKTAKLTFPLSAPNFNELPSSVDFYVFDPAASLWKKESTGTRTGNVVVADVPHFSFWSCPFVYNHLTLTGVATCGGMPLAAAKVTVYNPWGYALGSVYTNSVGIWQGQAPAGLNLTYKVFDPLNNPIYTSNIGTLSGNTTLPVTDVCSEGAQYGHITAQLNNCDGQPLSGGMLKVQSQGILKMLPATQSGLVMATVLFGINNQNAQCRGIHWASGLTGPEVTLPIQPQMEVGTQTVCDSDELYVSYKLDGNHYYYSENATTSLNVTANLNTGYLMMNVSSNQMTMFGLTVHSFVPGTYTVGGGGTGQGETLLYSFQVSGNNSQVGLTVHLTSAGNTLEAIIEGYIEDVTYYDLSNQPRLLQDCQFRLKVTNVI
jgi:hypothetical protein